MGSKDIKKRFEKDKKVSNKIVLALVVLIVISFIILIAAIYFKNNLEKNIRNHYSEVVITTKKAKLYDKNEQVIGSVSKGYLFDIKKINELGVKTKYFNIKDSDYYLYYDDVKPSKKKNIEELFSI